MDSFISGHHFRTSKGGGAENANFRTSRFINPGGIPPETMAMIERAKAQNSTLDLAGRYVQLRKAGKERNGPCPICKAGDDRFYIRVDQSWGCRKCGAGGSDSVALYARIHGVSNGVAAREMLGETSSRPVASAPIAPIAPIIEAPSISPEEFDREARKTIKGTKSALTLESPAGEYLAARNLSPETWRAWDLGQVERAGRLAVAIPWFCEDPVWMIHAVKFRFLKGEPRYTMLKGSTTRGLYGLQMVRGGGQERVLIVVEGEINALSVWQASRPEGWDVLSIGSESINGEQIEQLAQIIEARKYRHVVAWMDRGEKAQAVQLRLSPHGQGQELHLMKSPRGMDANDILQGYGAEGLRDLVAKVMAKREKDQK